MAVQRHLGNLTLQLFFIVVDLTLLEPKNVFFLLTILVIRDLMGF